MRYVTEDWILEMTTTEREVYLKDLTVLDKVKTYNTLPNTELMSTKLVAEWYGVTEIIMRNLFNGSRDELETSGAKTLRGEELKVLKETVGNSVGFGNACTVFSRKAVLNVGLLLRKSDTAKSVRLSVLGVGNDLAPKKDEINVEHVNFNGDELVAIRAEGNNKVYVGVKWVCEGIGLSEGQIKNERKKIQEDPLLMRGGRNLVLNTIAGKREALCLDLKFLPMWLARISITPNMQKNNPELASRLLKYQLEATDVLESVFIKKESVILPTTQKEALQMMIDKIEENEVLQLENEALLPKADFYDKTADAKGAELIVNTAKVLGVGEKKLFKFLRETQVLYKRGRFSIPRQEYMNSDYFEVTTGYRNLDGWHEQTFTTHLTESGKRFIYRHVKKYGGGAAINKLKLVEIEDYVKSMNEKLGYKNIS